MVCTEVSNAGGAAGAIVNGVQSSVAVNAGSKPAATTPTIVCGSRSTVTVRPTMPRSPPNPRIQSPSPSITTRAPERLSCSLKARPRITRAPSSVEKAGRHSSGGDAVRLGVEDDPAIGRPDALDAIEQPDVSAEANELERIQRIRVGEIGGARRLQEDAHQAIGIREGERTEQRRVGHGEHRTRCRHDQGHGDEPSRRQPGPRGQHAERG